MTLTLYRRHKRSCPNFGKPRRARQVKCKCKFWADGVLGGREVRMSLDTRDSKKANEKLHEWESKERVVEPGAPVTLADAWTSLLADLEARKLSSQTIRKYKVLERQMKGYGEDHGLSLLAQSVSGRRSLLFIVVRGQPLGDGVWKADQRHPLLWRLRGRRPDANRHKLTVRTCRCRRWRLRCLDS